MTRTLIADDHAIVRLGLTLLLRDMLDDSCTIVDACNGEQVLQQLRTAPFDILVTDMNMPQPAGFVLLEKALAAQPDLKILVISINAEELFARKVFQSGAYGFVHKNAGNEELRKALRTVIYGNLYYPSLLGNKSSHEETGSNPFKILSARELEVTLQLLKGKGILEVCNALAIKPSTGSTLKGRIFKKLGIQSPLELDHLARRFGVITDDSLLFGK